MRVFLTLHIAGGTIAIIAGYIALFAPKGEWLHRRAGMMFVYAMVMMGIGATVVGLVRDLPTWTGGPTVIYLVITAVTTMRARTAVISRLDASMLAIPLGIGGYRVYGGIMVAMTPEGAIRGIPAWVIIVSAVILLLAAAGDVRLLRRGVLKGRERLTRHLWRMCYATFVATSSFFLGQPRFVPALLRNWPTRLVLSFLPVIVLFYWLWRVRDRRHRLVRERSSHSAVEAAA